MSTKQPCTSQNTVPTAQILEHVEKLLALHQSQVLADEPSLDHPIDNSLNLNDLLDRHSVKMIASFESLSQKYHEKNIEILKAIGNLVERRFEEIEQRLPAVTTRLEFDSVTVSHAAANEIQAPIDPGTTTNQPTNIDADDSVSHWEIQKAAMLEKYGINTDYRPVQSPPPVISPEIEPPPEPVRDQLDDIQHSINTMSEMDAEAVEALKRDLNSKLRDAEIELSINRAKIIQQTAEMEKRRIELDHRTAALEKKYASQTQLPEPRESDIEKSGILDRFKRHLPTRKDPNE